MSFINKICGSVKQYEWGKPGSRSVVAALTKSAFTNINIDDVSPYAELWFGTHPSGHSTIPSFDGSELNDYFRSHPANLGKNIVDRFDASKGLPFLLKILSVNKALSIQVHPDKSMAKKLFSADPEHYPDDNHKPELAIALTPFEALCGFRPMNEILEFFQDITELMQIVSQRYMDISPSNSQQNNLKILFTSVMNSVGFEQTLEKIVLNFKEDEYPSELCESIKDVFLRTSEQYPNDIGCLCFFFLNYLKLDPGESIFLAANEPHAYLLGDCIECMACSDNVVRAGLTPKFRDVKTLCDILTYECKTADENKFIPTADGVDPYVKTFNPPIPDFAVDVISIPAKTNYKPRVIESASILLVLKGTCSYESRFGSDDLVPGSALCLSSGAELSIVSVEKSEIVRAYCGN